MSELQISDFGGLITAFDGDAPKGASSDNLNVRLGTRGIKPRYGYRNIASSPASFEQALAFRFLAGYSTGNVYAVEGLAIEKRSGVIKPYSVNVTTGVRTVIKDGTTDLDLPDGTYVIEVFQDTAYVICYDGTDTFIYSHLIGDLTSWTTVQDTTYTPAPTDPEISITRSALGIIQAVVGTDTFTFTADNTITTPTAAASGTGFTVSGNANDNGPTNPMGVTVQVDYASTKNYSGSDYIAIVAELGPQFDDLKNDNYTPQLKIGGVWTNVVDYQEYKDETGCTLVCNVKGLTLTAIQGIRFRLTTTHVAYRDANNRVAFTVQAIKLGGVYLEATSSSERLWDASPGDDGVKFGIRFTDGGANRSAVYEYTISKDEALGFYPSSYSCPLGARIYVSSVSAPSGLYNRVEVLRLLDDGSAWKIIGTATAAPYTKYDPYCEYELSGLTTATGTSGGTVIPAIPSFDGTGKTGLFSFFGRMCWIDGTRLEYSEFGNPLSLYDAAAAGSYDADVLTNPATFTIADNYADVGVTGGQAGRVGAIIFGKKAAYAQRGIYPMGNTLVPSMSPPGVIRGSQGIAGPFAASEYMTPTGAEGFAYVAHNGRLFFIPNYTISTEQGLGTAKVVDMSIENPEVIWEYLVTEQFLEFGYTDLSECQLIFDKRDGQLRAHLGNRAMIVQKVPGKEAVKWIKHEYALTSESTVEGCTDYSNYLASASNVADASYPDWSNPSYAVAGAGSYATCGTLPLGSPSKTDILRVDGLTPLTPVPLDATLTSVSFRVTRKKTGDLTLTESKVQPRKSGASSGSDLTTSYVLTESDVATVFTKTTGLPTVAEFNAGAMGLDLQYQQQASHADWNDPSKWTITVSGGGTAAVMTITVTYIGAGTVPSFVYLNIASLVHVTITAEGGYAPVDPWTGNVVMDPGLGDTASGTVAQHTMDGGDHDAEFSDSARVRVTLTAGTATYVVTRSVTGTVDRPHTVLVPTYTGSAALSPYVLSTAYVDTVEIDACFELVSSVTSGVSWPFVDFLDPDMLWALRSTGNLDELRFNSETKRWIEGNSNRDGGYMMPDPFWQSSWLRTSENSMLLWVRIEKETPNDSMTVSALTDRDGTLNVGANVRDSYKWNVSQQGKAHQVKIQVSEGSEAVNVATIGFQEISSQFSR